MKIKVIAIFVIAFLVATTIPAFGKIVEKDSISDYQNIGEKGGLFRQLPSLPDDSAPYGLISDLQMGLQVYEDFWEVPNPICHIHWWGHAIKSINDSFYPGDPEGMVFDIIFYEDESGSPGNDIYTFSDISPSIIGTGVFYDHPDWSEGPSELYYFEADLSLCFELSDGWVSIIKKYSSNDSIFGWAESSDGNDNLFQNDTQLTRDVAFILAESGEPELEIDVKGGLGASVKVINIGNETLTNIPVDIMVYGGMLRKINVQVRETINLNSGDTASVGTGLFLGIGKITIGIVADDVVEYKSGFQLLFLTIIK